MGLAEGLLVFVKSMGLAEVLLVCVKFMGLAEGLLVCVKTYQGIKVLTFYTNVSFTIATMDSGEKTACLC